MPSVRWGSFNILHHYSITLQLGIMELTHIFRFPPCQLLKPIVLEVPLLGVAMVQNETDLQVTAASGSEFILIPILGNIC